MFTRYKGVRSSDHEIYHLFDLFCLKKNSFSKAEQHIFVHLDNYLPRHQIRTKDILVILCWSLHGKKYIVLAFYFSDLVNICWLTLEITIDLPDEKKWSKSNILGWFF